MSETTIPASENFKKLKDKLRELFEIDKADLDFGIYRILRQRHREITEFLDRHLAKTVIEALQSHHTEERAQLLDEMRRAEEAARGAGISPSDSPRVMALKARLESGGSLQDTADEVYSHLYIFFSRYYQEGDFLGLQRSTLHGREKYVIPYNGEEVKLVWANMDQYYIKSSELLRDYRFRVRSSDGPLFAQSAPTEYTVEFKLVDADTEKDNRKADGRTSRVFSLEEEKPFEEIEPDHLRIYFRYHEQAAERNLQDKVNVATLNQLRGSLPALWRGLLLTVDSDDKTVLQRHMRTYTARNQFDYFIHKDLGAFLRRELDFYIKNEVVYLDDIENSPAPKAEVYLSKIRALRRCALPIVRMLAQIEDFQKKLWLKKKFVVETRYCVAVGQVPDLHAVICRNDAQWQEWESTYAAQTASGPGLFDEKSRSPEFLRAHPGLILDTKNFDREFYGLLQNAIEDLDQLDGLFVQSENFQALQLIGNRFQGSIRSVYADPPFNLGQNADFLYRTDYKDSTWACLLNDRIGIVRRRLLGSDGFMLLRCDHNGNFIVRLLMDEIFGKSGFHAELLVQRIRKNITTQGRTTLPLAQDSLFLYQQSEESELVFPYLRLNATRKSYWRRIDDSAGFRNPPGRIIFGRLLYPYKRDAHFKFSQANIDRMAREGRVRLRCKRCEAVHTQGDWAGCQACGEDDPGGQYLVEETDVKILDTNWLDIAGYAHSTGFSTENSEVLLRRVIEATTGEGEWVLDFFAGSGTTAAVALQLNRRFVTVEVGDHGEAIVLPRLKRAMSASLEAASRGNEDGPVGLMKIIRLESYEDTIANLRLQRSAAAEAATQSAEEWQRNEYMLGYFLELESEGSASLLDVSQFKDPFSYKLDIATRTAGETKPTNVDLVETFNWLLGLKVKHIDHQKGFVTVTGEKLSGERVLIIWRTLSDDPLHDNEALERFLGPKGIQVNPAETAYGFIYVNGSTTLSDPHNKIHLIEEEFHRLMFEGEALEVAQ